MSTVSYTMLTHQSTLSYTGEQIRGDASYGSGDGLHTVSVQLTDFVGRIYIEGTLSSSPTESDWFPIYLTSSGTYVEYPMNSSAPTGDLGRGDTITSGFTFRMNAMYLRARVDRSYLVDTVYSADQHGQVDKILLNV